MDCKVYKDIEINQIQNTRHDIYIYIRGRNILLSGSYGRHKV